MGCALLTQDTEDILPPPLCSEEECPLRKLTSKCLTSKTRTLLISLNGSQTTSNPLFAISHQRDSRWLLPSSVTPPCPRNVQESRRTIHRHVQKKGFPPLVHRRRYGRDGVHRGRIQHERSLFEYQQYQDATAEDEEEMDE